MLGDGTAKGFPLLGVAHRLFQGGLADAHALGGDDYPAGVQDFHSVTEAPALFSQQVLGGHRGVLEHYLVGAGAANPHLAVQRGDLHPRRPLGDDECADAPVTLGTVLGGEHHHRLGHVGVGNEHLAAVEEVGAVPLHRRGLQGCRVGAAAGFGQRPGRHAFAGGQGGYKPLFLLLVAEAVDGAGAEGEVGNEAGAGGQVAPGDFLGGNGYLAIAAAAAPVLRVNADAGQPQPGHALPALPVKLLLLVHFPGVGRQLSVGKIPNQVLQHSFFFFKHRIRHALLLQEGVR